jgi:hypothetical protein
MMHWKIKKVINWWQQFFHWIPFHLILAIYIVVSKFLEITYLLYGSIIYKIAKFISEIRKIFLSSSSSRQENTLYWVLTLLYYTSINLTKMIYFSNKISHICICCFQRSIKQDMIFFHGFLHFILNFPQSGINNNRIKLSPTTTINLVNIPIQ